MGRALTWVLFLFAIFLLLAGLYIHVATYLDLPLMERWPILWGVYFLAFVLFGIVISDARYRTGVNGKTPLFTAFEPRFRFLAEGTAAIVLIYALLVFGADWFLRSASESPSRIEGKPVISNHGKIVRELDEKEYAHLKAVEMRGMSAIFLVFVTWDALELLSLVLREEQKHRQGTPGRS